MPRLKSMLNIFVCIPLVRISRMVHPAWNPHLGCSMASPRPRQDAKKNESAVTKKGDTLPSTASIFAAKKQQKQIIILVGLLVQPGHRRVRNLEHKMSRCCLLQRARSSHSFFAELVLFAAVPRASTQKGPPSLPLLLLLRGWASRAPAGSRGRLVLSICALARNCGPQTR